MNTPKELAEFVKERDRVTCAVVEGEPLDTFKAFYRRSISVRWSYENCSFDYAIL